VIASTSAQCKEGGMGPPAGAEEKLAGVAEGGCAKAGDGAW